MNESDDRTGATSAIIEDVREHLRQAQMLIDAMEPSSIIGARLEQLIDALGTEP